MKIFKKLCSYFLVFCLSIVSVLLPASTQANAAEGETLLTLKIGDTIYENVTSGSVITGDFDIKNLEFWVQSVNGHPLENVGNKSTATDAQGRNPLEIGTNKETDNLWTVTLIYHAEDDPVEANREYGFTVVGIIFTNSEDATIEVPTVSKISNFKASSMSKALKLTWKKKSVDGYQIQYSLNKDFKSAKTIKVSKSKTSYTIKSLKANKKYYVRIRGYKNYTDDLNNEQTVYGKWVSLNKKTK